jgi:Xaa-Pro aminopeptidase
MRRSAQITAAVLMQCMRVSRPGVLEHQLAATFEFECK